MTGSGKPRARQGLFRAIALERYKGPLQADTPHTLPPWRLGLVLTSAIIAIVLVLFWLQ